jgi:cytoskeletal protein CcmA (bactofilin family)
MWGKRKDGSDSRHELVPKRFEPAAPPSIISREMKVVGTIASRGEIQIDGEVEGDVYASAVVIGDEGIVHGNVVAVDLTINGRVRGRVRARKVALGPHSIVDGHMVHGRTSPVIGSR